MHGTWCQTFHCRSEKVGRAMHAEAILARVLGPCLNTMHAKRACALLRATAGLLRGGITSLSSIALSLDGEIAYKHRIKSVDRLLGNTGLHLAFGELYRCIALRWLKDLPQSLERQSPRPRVSITRLDIEASLLSLLRWISSIQPAIFNRSIIRSKCVGDNHA
jgi:hypothetical protein